MAILALASGEIQELTHKFHQEQAVAPLARDSQPWQASTGNGIVGYPKMLVNKRDLVVGLERIADARARFGRLIGCVSIKAILTGEKNHDRHGD